MTDLEGAGLQHGDLSPSNIIVRRDAQGECTLVLVDLGVNYLYLHAAPGSGGPDAAYIAPEVRARGQNVERADIYSVGQLLIAVAGAPGGWPDRPSVVTDDFYAESPVLARFLKDLIDRDPARRLLIFQPDATQPFYPQLLTFFEEELAAVSATRADRTDGVRGLFTPLSGAPARALNMWRIRRSQMLYRNPRRGMHVRWLMFWSWLSAVAWYVSGTIVIYWWLQLRVGLGQPADRRPPVRHRQYGRQVPGPGRAAGLPDQGLLGEPRRPAHRHELPDRGHPALSERALRADPADHGVALAG